MKQLVAIVAAAAMIGLSLFVRSRIDDNGGGSSSGRGPLRIVCVPELANECAAIESGDVHTSVEAPTDTMQHLDRYDGWLTFDPWPAMAPTTGNVTRLGSAALEIAIVKDRADALNAACGGTVSWKCLGDKRGQDWAALGGDPSWGKLKVGLPPGRSAVGLLLYADAIASYFGRTDYGTNDFDAEFIGWQANVKQMFAASDPFATFIAQLPAAYTAVGTTAAATGTALGTKADRVTVVNESSNAVVVLASTGGRKLDAVSRNRTLHDVLTRDGWTGDANTSPGLPSAGVLAALLADQ